MAKSKKQIHQEVSDIVKKYLSTSQAQQLRKKGILSGAFGGGMIAVDLLLLGGILTGTLIIAGTVGSLLVGGEALTLNWARKRQNTAKQTYKAKPLVVNTLEEMESRLKSAFKVAAAPHAHQTHKDAFERLAAEVHDDLQKLSPAFKITAGGPLGYTKDQFELVVSEEMLAPGNVKQITLSHILNDITDAAAKKQALEKSQQEEIEKLKTRLDELENGQEPFPIKPFKKNPRPE